MKKIIFILAASLFVVACNKNQKSANKLEGKWNATSFIFNNAGTSGSTYNSIVEEDRTLTYNFLECKVKKDEPCICEYKMVDGGGYTTEFNYFYNVEDKGETVRIGHDLNDPENYEVYTISKLTKKELEMNTVGPEGSTTYLILEKL